MPPPATLSSFSSSSPRCVPFVCRGGEQRSARTRGPPPAQAQAPAPPASQRCGRPLGRAGRLVGGGIAAAFFASLDRCACVELRTIDDDLDYKTRDDAEAAPLMVAAGVTTTATKSKRTAAGKGKRGGFGCCENIN